MIVRVMSESRFNGIKGLMDCVGEAVFGGVLEADLASRLLKDLIQPVL